MTVVNKINPYNIYIHLSQLMPWMNLPHVEDNRLQKKCKKINYFSLNNTANTF